MEIGKYNKLRIKRMVDFGAYLVKDGEDEEVLMPKKYLEVNARVGEYVNRCFVYLDSEDRLVATTEEPAAQVGEVAFLQCKTVTRVGAFMDWGLLKDLLVPYSQQIGRMEVDKWYIVYVYLDPKTKRIAATQKIDGFLNNLAPRYQQGDEVEAIIVKQTPMGYQAVINNQHTGMLYNNTIFKRLKIGDRLPLYIGKVREDDKIDLLPEPVGFAKTATVEDQILEALRMNGRVVPLGDKSSAEDIMLVFKCSKKTFKMTAGNLMKRGMVEIEDHKIKLK